MKQKQGLFNIKYRLQGAVSVRIFLHLNSYYAPDVGRSQLNSLEKFRVLVRRVPVFGANLRLVLSSYLEQIWGMMQPVSWGNFEASCNSLLGCHFKRDATKHLMQSQLEASFSGYVLPVFSLLQPVIWSWFGDNWETVFGAELKHDATS